MKKIPWQRQLKGETVYSGVQFEDTVHHGREVGFRSSRQLVTLSPQLRSKEWYVVVFSSLSPYYLLQDPSPDNGATHSCGVSFHPNGLINKNASQAPKAFVEVLRGLFPKSFQTPSCWQLILTIPSEGWERQSRLLWLTSSLRKEGWKKNTEIILLPTELKENLMQQQRGCQSGNEQDKVGEGGDEEGEEE